jgi:hypothetical protein
VPWDFYGHSFGLNNSQEGTMKHFISGILLLISTASLLAQSDSTQPVAPDPTKTLITSDNFTSGGFGGLVLKAGSMDGALGIFVGGRGGWVINRTFVVGGGGYGWANSMHMTGYPTNARDTNATFGYGGLELEYLINSSEIVHGTVMMLIGAGGFSVIERSDSDENAWYGGRTLYSTTTFVIEPAANVELNILRWLRLGVGAGYRVVTGIDANINGRVYDNTTASGFFGVATIKFGIY